MNQQPIAIPPTYKTKEDFLHWLQEKKANQQQAAEHAARFDRRAVMVWVDEGGGTIAAIEAETGLPVFDFPKEREYFVEMKLRA